MNKSFVISSTELSVVHPPSHEVNYSEGIDICSFFGILSS